MRTLSIRQPYAWLICAGHKPVENRDWSTGYRGEFLIHAGQSIVQRDYLEIMAYLDDELGIKVPHFTELDQVPRGGIVGVATLVDVVKDHASPFFLGPFAFVLKDARPLPFTKCKGQLGWFDVQQPQGLAP